VYDCRRYFLKLFADVVREDAAREEEGEGCGRRRGGGEQGETGRREEAWKEEIDSLTHPHTHTHAHTHARTLSLNYTKATGLPIVGA